MHHAAEHRLGVALVTAAAVAWSLAGFFTRLIPLDAWTILFWRGVFGGFFISLYVIAHYRGRTLAVTRAMGWPGRRRSMAAAIRRAIARSFGRSTPKRSTPASSGRRR